MLQFTFDKNNLLYKKREKNNLCKKREKIKLIVRKNPSPHSPPPRISNGPYGLVKTGPIVRYLSLSLSCYHIAVACHMHVMILSTL